MPITALPTPPSRQDPANFAARGDALLSALPTFVTDANALEVNVNAKEVLATKAGVLAQLALDAGLAAAPGILLQTRTARDEAIAGLGAADQSQNLVLLAAGLQHALDIAGQAADWPLNVARAEALLAAVCVALDLAGVTAKQVNGGAVQLAAGTPSEPALWPTADRNTGVYFPAADALALVTAGLERLRLDAAGNLGIGTNAPSGLLDVNDNRLRVRTAKTPATAAAAGNAGEICWDAGFVYVCTATNTWRRTALVAW